MSASIKQLALRSPAGPLASAVMARIRRFRSRNSQGRQYDRQSRAVLERILLPDSNCVDVGCNKGDVLRSMVQLAPRGKHFAFEPIPILAEGLRRGFPNVNVHNAAVSDVAGFTTFRYVPQAPGLSGLKGPWHKVDYPIEEIPVQLVRLDDVIPSDVPIQLMKVDVEGAELSVFRGAEQLLRRSKPFVLFEHGAAGRELYATSSDAIFDVLGECGLSLFLMEDWLAGRSALSRSAFAASASAHWEYLAAPAAGHG